MADQTRSLHQRTRAGDATAYAAFERRIEFPMIVLAVVLAAILIVQFAADLSTSLEWALGLVASAIWILFVLEFVVLFWLAPNKKQMLRTHLLDLFLIAVPVLRPLRILRILRAGSGLSAVWVLIRRMEVAVIGVTGFVLAGGLLAALFERGRDDAQITSIADGLWWAVVTCTTVGYGDVTPVSPAGRTIAVILMIVGVGLVSIVTANIASYLVESETEDEQADLRAQLAEVNAKLDRLLAERG